MSRRAVLTAAAVAAIASVVGTGCLPGGSPDVPEDLVGVWTTDDPRYADRALHISADSVRFDTGGDTFTIHPIRRFTSERGDAGRTRFDLHYDVPGGAAVLSFQHGDGILVLENRPRMTWRREGGAPGTAPNPR